MNVIPKAAPAVANSQAAPQQAQTARERAIAKITQPSHESQRPPVNPNSVSAEELGSVRIQNDTSEATTAQDTPQAAPKAPESNEPPLSSQYAVLARKERALRVKAQQQEAAIANREAAIAAREAALQAKDAEYSSKYISKDKLSNDTVNALLEAGMTYEQITQSFLNQPNPQEQANLAYQRKVEEKIKAIEEKYEQQQKAQAESQQQQYKQALDQISLEAKSLVQSDPEAYEAIQATGSIKDVVKLIERTFAEDGVLLSVEDAAKEVEDYLTEEATKLSRLKKIQRALNTKAPQASPVQQPQQKQQPQLKTLSNAVGNSGGKLSAKERAILAFKGELNK